MLIDARAGTMAERKEDTLQQVEPVRGHITDFTCTGCGCLCDDLAIALSDAGTPEIENVNCSLASRFLARQVEQLTRAWSAPAALAVGEAAPLRKALYIVESLLSLGSRPRARIIFGATESSLEAQRAAVRLADQVSATITVGPNLTGSPRWLARQRAGWVTATWGEIAQRADLVLLWDLDPQPDGTHPRFAERFLNRPGRFVPEGASGRTVLRLSTWTAPPDEKSSDSIRVPPTGLLAVLSTLRALIRGRAVDAARLEVATGRPLEFWADLVRQLASARFGVVATGPIFDGNASIAECEALERLIADVNAFGSGRCVGCTLGAGGNQAGLEAVLGWQAGAPGPIDFSSGAPRYLPFEVEPALRFEPGQEVVVLGIGPRSQAVETAIGSSRDVLWFQIGYDATLQQSGTRVPDVAIASAHPWLEAGGTVMRGDGVCLPLTPLFRARRPPEAWFLNRLCRKIAKRSATP